MTDRRLVEDVLSWLDIRLEQEKRTMMHIPGTKDHPDFCRAEGKFLAFNEIYDLIKKKVQ